MLDKRFRWLLTAGAAAILATTLAWSPAAHAKTTKVSPQADFISRAAPAAIANRLAYGVPPSVTVAQAILESNWGKSPLAKNEKNHFGMKCADNAPGPIAKSCVTYPTKECNATGCFDSMESFRSYASIIDSFRDHGRKLYEAQRYDPAFKYPNDADQFIREVHKAGYATDPRYSDKVIKLMHEYDLYRFN